MIAKLVPKIQSVSMQLFRFNRALKFWLMTYTQLNKEQKNSMQLLWHHPTNAAATTCKAYASLSATSTVVWSVAFGWHYVKLNTSFTIFDGVKFFVLNLTSHAAFQWSSKGSWKQLVQFRDDLHHSWTLHHLEIVECGRVGWGVCVSSGKHFAKFFFLETTAFQIYALQHLHQINLVCWVCRI